MQEDARTRWRRRLSLGSWLGAALMLVVIGRLVAAEYIEPYRSLPGYSLFDRTVVYEEMPAVPLDFLRENDLAVRLFTHWNASQFVMWKAPKAKLFIDARATQVYPGDHFANYRDILIPGPDQAPRALRLLEQSGTDALLLQARPDMAPLMAALDRNNEWVPVFFWDHWVVYLRRGSAPMNRLKQLELRGEGWWPRPDGNRLTIGERDDPQIPRRALYYYRNAVNKIPALGACRYRPMVLAWLALGEPARAREYLAAQEARLSRLKGVAVEVQDRLRESIEAARQVLEQ